MTSILTLCIAASAGLAGSSSLASGALSIRDLPLPQIAVVGVELSDAATDRSRDRFSAFDVGLFLSTTSPALAWSDKSEASLSDLEDSLGGTAGPSNSSNELTVSGRLSGIHPNGGSIDQIGEEFTKMTVVPLPSAGLLGVAGLAIVGVGSRRRR
tara:strand:- start:1681 stop:2145 length:465 start_codon:yes stop_codon:yes gene_type:complete